MTNVNQSMGKWSEMNQSVVVLAVGEADGVRMQVGACLEVSIREELEWADIPALRMMLHGVRTRQQQHCAGHSTGLPVHLPSS